MLILYRNNNKISKCFRTYIDLDYCVGDVTQELHPKIVFELNPKTIIEM